MFNDNHDVWTYDIGHSNKLKHKGVTLIELIVYLSLLSIIMGISIISISSFMKMKEDMKINSICKSSYSFLVNSCAECRVEKQPGRIYIDGDKINFTISGVCKRNIKLGEGFSLVYNGVKNNIMDIESNGRINLNGTLLIDYKDKNKAKIIINNKIIGIRYEEG